MFRIPWVHHQEESCMGWICMVCFTFIVVSSPTATLLAPIHVKQTIQKLRLRTLKPRMNP